MIKLFFDIETLPSADEHKDVHLEILRKKSKSKKIDEDKLHRETALEGTFGGLLVSGSSKKDHRVLSRKKFSQVLRKKFLRNSGRLHSECTDLSATISGLLISHLSIKDPSSMA